MKKSFKWVQDAGRQLSLWEEVVTGRSGCRWPWGLSPLCWPSLLPRVPDSCPPIWNKCSFPSFSVLGSIRMLFPAFWLCPIKLACSRLGYMACCHPTASCQVNAENFTSTSSCILSPSHCTLLSSGCHQCTMCVHACIHVCKCDGPVLIVGRARTFRERYSETSERRIFCSIIAAKYLLLWPLSFPLCW